MSQQTKLIREITPAKRGWTAKVIVCEKSMPRISKRSLSKYQHLILADNEGTKVQATIFGVNIQRFQHTLNLCKSYLISRADVEPIPLMHRIVENKYQWNINENTEIVEIPKEDCANMPNNPLKIPFVPFDVLDSYKQSDAEVDVIALALEIQPAKNIQTYRGLSQAREITLINDKKKTMLLTLWGQFVDEEGAAIANIISSVPVIAALRVRVTSYNNISLSTKGTSCVLTEPDLPEAIALRTWRSENQNYLQELRIEKSDPSSSKVIIGTKDDIIEIDKIPVLLQQEAEFWIKAKISLTNFDQKFWYMACDKCHKPTTNDYNELFDCLRCYKENSKAIPRCCIQVQLTDTSGTLVGTMFGPNAEKFLHCTSVKLMEHTTEDGIPDIQSFAQTSTSKEHIMCVKASKKEYGHDVEYRYIINRLLDNHNIAP